MNQQVDLFRVVAYNNAGMWDYKTDWVPAQEAMAKATELCGKGADVSDTSIVRVIDQGDYACFDWSREKGVIFPTPKDIEDAKAQRNPT